MVRATASQRQQRRPGAAHPTQPALRLVRPDPCSRPDRSRSRRATAGDAPSTPTAVGRRRSRRLISRSMSSPVTVRVRHPGASRGVAPDPTGRPRSTATRQPCNRTSASRVYPVVTAVTERGSVPTPHPGQQDDHGRAGGPATSFDDFYPGHEPAGAAPGVRADRRPAAAQDGAQEALRAGLATLGAGRPARRPRGVGAHRGAATSPSPAGVAPGRPWETCYTTASRRPQPPPASTRAACAALRDLPAAARRRGAAPPVGLTSRRSPSRTASPVGTVKARFTAAGQPWPRHRRPDPPPLEPTSDEQTLTQPPAQRRSRRSEQPRHGH